MASEIKLPALGENLEGGDVLDVRVEAGATVTKGQALVEIEAEKSTVEVPSPLDGRITQMLVKKGDRVTVGQTLALIEAGETAKNGDTSPTPVAEVAAPEKPAPVAETPAPPVNRLPPVTAPRSEAPSSGKLVPAGPATRRLARELGIDLHHVAGSASGGRVIEEDVKAYVRQLASGSGPTSGGVKAPPLPDFAKWGPIDKKPFEAVRRRTADQMSLSWSLIPHVTQSDVADVTDLDAFRRQQEGNGPKLTVTAFAIKAVAIALREFPQFNASLDLAGGQLIFKNYVHIGVAVDTERGLLVPVLRDVDRKSVVQLAQEMHDIADKARQKKITADEMRGGSFTVTNLGGIGGTHFTPIINYPEVAILGMARSRLTPVVRDGQIVPRLLLPLCLSYDHRVIDGADAARFTRRLAELLEKPLLMVLHG